MTTVSYVSVWHIIQCGRPAQGTAYPRQPDRDPYRHCRGGVSSSAAVRMALGGHMADGVEGGKRRIKPLFAPT